MNNTDHAVLYALFTMAQNDRHATVLRVVGETGLSRDRVEGSLVSLDRAGLVDRERVRLTMRGLSAAVILGPSRAIATNRKKAA